MQFSTTQPTSVVGLNLARRAIGIATARAAREHPASNTELDLTAPETTLAPLHVRAAAEDALDRGETHYTSRPGVPELRRAIASRSTEDGFPATPDSVVVTNGGSEAVYITLQALLKPGDLLITGPISPDIADMGRFIGVDLDRREVDDLESALSTASTADSAGRQKVLLIGSPSPITGEAMPVTDLERLISRASEHQLPVIVDRSLAGCFYDPDSEPRLSGNAGQAVYTIGSFSFHYGLAGWRIGYFTAPTDTIGALRELKQAMSICTSAVSQYAALAALEGPEAWLSDRRQMFARRRDAATALLQEAGLGVKHANVYPPLLIDSRPIDADDRRAVERLRLEAGVIVEPGSAFGTSTQGFVRIDLRTPEVTLQQGLERITRMLQQG